MFTEITRKLFSDAGWYAGRLVDISQTVSELEKMGYTVYPAVQAFLREFDRLQIKFNWLPEKKSRFPDYLSFTPLDNASSYQPSLLREREEPFKKYLGEFPCCIGWWGTDMWDNLLMDSKGRVYNIATVLDEDIDLIALSGYEAIENILRGRWEYITKQIHPDNEDKVYQILMSKPVIASIGHTNDNDKRYKSGYWVDRYLRELGYTVYTVNPHPETITDMSDVTIYSSLAEVPEQVEMVIYHHYKNLSEIIQQASQVGVKYIFASCEGHHPQEKIQAEQLGIEFFDDYNLLTAHEKLIQTDKIHHLLNLA